MLQQLFSLQTVISLHTIIPTNFNLCVCMYAAEVQVNTIQIVIGTKGGIGSESPRTTMINIVNTANKEIAHSFKGQQLETILLYRFVIYIGLLEKFLALI